MPKINVYLPDELAEAVKEAGLSVSPICQRALEQAVRRVTAIREAVAHDLGDLGESGGLARFTARARTVLRLAAERAAAEGSPNVGTGHLLAGLLAEGGNLALQVLGVLEISAEQLTEALAHAELGGEAGGRSSTAVAAGVGASQGSGPAVPALRLSGPAADAVESTVNEAAGLGHNYVGCEHLLLGLVTESDGVGGRLLREAGAEQRLTRRAVAAALAGYVHLRANQPPQAEQPASPQPSTEQLQALAAFVRRELQPLVERIERLEARG
ncbi:Clp protease N-terminal domain-containing protein [Kitasatospora sp. GAS204B]|uniref:Clp protease N-terminal domain-containing protein n=1 Tax=unclassified Kitasatospora TaxID=2633591 RepID=UPI002473BDE3|nr:Clp protease N-terminal domain-containing protein [Kitasatospora sp. GAS204B]MDH6119127.1 ATP-dependent Clp protease ATP-binding subunit ClpA [Kitasatospora sp. GAS204B]